MRKNFLLLIIQLSIFSAFAQIRVDVSQNIINVVKKLEGPGVKISNISYRFSPHAAQQPAGFFADDFGATGLNQGLLLTTGAAINAIGPNYHSHITQINKDTYQDPDLTPFIEDYNAGSNAMADECFVEFDLISAYPFISFNYVFASEEYIETLDYHDVFAFLISGPGITGKKNIALVPGTNIPVSVGSISPYINSQYYVSNGAGNTPYINIDLQYDGYTTVLQARAEVIPCMTYHVKLAIADVLDDTYDAGVFIEEGSFIAETVDLKLMYEYPRFHPAIEGCNNAMIIFKRPAYSDASQELKFKFDIKGNAENGIDYVQIADSIIIPTGQDSAYIVIDPFDDKISDDNEWVRLVLKSSCPLFPDTDSIEVSIKESFPYYIPPGKVCSGNSAQLNQSPFPTDSFTWDASPYLSCFDCPSPEANPPASTYFPFTVKDTVSGCITRDSALMNTIKVKADFSFYQEPCYTRQDYFFINNSQNATSFFWSFGDNSQSEEAEPVHQFPFSNKKETSQYTVTLTAQGELSCTDDTTITIDISDPLFIPNLITANKDKQNDVFSIKGLISTDCWTLFIYNRWGEPVYEEKNYENDFDAENLDNGIYFYHIQNNPNDREYKGWLEVLK